MKTTKLMLCATAVLLLGACGQEPERQVVGGAPTAVQPDDATYRDFGDYVLHFNALTTDQLTPEVAKQYGIVRSKNRALLNVSIIQKQAGSTGRSVPGSVSASARNLTGQLKNLVLREIREGDAVYYIGDVPVSNGETLFFTVDATPINETSRFSVQFSRQFFTD